MIPGWRVGIAATMGAALLTVAGPAPAAPATASPCPLDVTPSARWQGLLGRRVSLRDSELPLRVALERLAAAAGIRLTYASDVVALDRAVCATFSGLAAGDVLAGWLGGAAEPVLVGADQVVLAPVPSRRLPLGPPGRARPAVLGTELQPVVVVADAEAGREPGETTSRDVIGRDRLARATSGGGAGVSLAALFDGVVPGVWLWDGGPASLLTGVGSVRGASSFGVSFPKVYVDGVEVANPLLIGRLSPDAIEEVELVRGPQGTALYGSGAISGVIKITTRRAAVAGAGSARRVDFTSSAGYAGSAYAPEGALVQDHSLSFGAGSSTRSVSASITAARVGAYVPGAFSRQLAATMGAMFIGRQSRLQTTLRIQRQGVREGLDGSPVLDRAGGPTPADPSLDPGRQALSSYTVGSQLAIARGPVWTHTLTVGVDGYSLSGVGAGGHGRRDPSDSALVAAAGRADRGTLRLSSEARVGVEGVRSALLTLGLDHSLLREATVGSSRRHRDASQVRGSLGALAHASLELRRSLFVNAGLRLEHNAGLIGQELAAALPSIGVAGVRRLGSAAVTVRAGYGKAIRAPQGLAVRGSGDLTALAPEQQDGFDLGLDIDWDGGTSLRLTHFDQRATGLILPVAGVALGQHVNGSYQPRRALHLQNVGEIANRGWEVQASAGAPSLRLSGTVALVDSRVVHVASGYAGDLRAGDRMLQVPSVTSSLGLSGEGRGWSWSAVATRAWDWVNYDWAALGAADAQPATPMDTRRFWMTYPGVTRLRVGLARDLSRGLSLLLSGDNLLGVQRGQPDNVTIVPGRTITAGFRTRL